MICENCGIEHDGQYGSGRFCSVKCARGFSTKEKRQEINEKVSKSLSGNNIKNPHRFNSRELKKKWKNKNYRDKVKNGLLEYHKNRKEILHLTRPIEEWSNDDRRNFLLEGCNHSCSVCGYNKIHPKYGVPPLEIHHIDGNNKNNVIENLMVVCLNCHFMVDDNYRFRGRGK